MEKLKSYNLADEVVRLKNLYPKTELRYIEACTEFKYMSTFLQVIQSEATRIRMDSFVPDYDNLRSHLDQNTNNSSSLNKQINNVVDSKIICLLSKLADLEIEYPILTADYKVKLQCQQKFIDRLNLVCQKAP